MYIYSNPIEDPIFRPNIMETIYIYIYFGDLIWRPNIIDFYIFICFCKSYIYNNITVCIYSYIDNIGFPNILGLQIRSP